MNDDDLITKFRLKIGNPPKRHKIIQNEYQVAFQLKATKGNYPSVNMRGESCGNGLRKGGSRGTIRMPSETIDRRKEPSYRASKCQTYFLTPSP